MFDLSSLSTMNVLSFAAIAAGATFIATCFKQIKAFFISFSNIFMERHYLNYSTKTIVMAYMRSNMKRVGFRIPTYCHDFFRTEKNRHGTYIPFSVDAEETSIYLKGLSPIFSSGKGKDMYDYTMETYLQRSCFSFVRGTVNFEKIVTAAFEEFEKTKALEESSKKSIRFSITRVYGQQRDAMTSVLEALNKKDKEEATAPTAAAATYLADKLILASRRKSARPIGHKLEDISNASALGRKPFDIFPYPDDVMEAVKEARIWKTSRHWYSSKFIPWRRGFLLEGTPGSGKTQFTKCLAQDLDMPVYLFDLASMNNQELYEFWDKSAANAPCFVVLEDFDNVFHGRDNICSSNGSKISFDALLNCISGIKQSDGVFLVITANDVTKIDPAIGVTGGGGKASRPGRIDRIIHMDKMDADCRRKLASRLLEMPPNSEIINEIVEKGDNMTAAQFCEICNNECLSNFWLKNGTKALASVGG